VGVLHDVTRLRRLETVRRDFVANVSHELRTPVAAIQGYSEAMLDGATDLKYAEVIHRNALRLGRLVADLLQLSRLEALEPGDITHEAVEVRPIAEHVAETVGGAITVEVPTDLVVRGAPDGVERMLLNLTENAVKYGHAASVTIRGARKQDVAEISVEDQGPGIPSQHLPRIFERFYRVDPARTTSEGGTGLGLAIVKHLAESMGGGVSVESEVGKGSRFTVRLPIYRT
jgi:two-component system phosphate regulon sensor histidine kinase PhoR